MNKPLVDVFDDAAALTAAAARTVQVGLEIALASPRRASLVATGGRSPGPVYDALARLDLAWDRVDVTLSDERWVEPSSPDSNERLVRERLLVGKAAAASFVPLKHPLASPAESAVQSETAIAALRPFDVVLLGMGDDGHIASLFPGNPALAEGLNADGDRLVIGVPRGEPAPDLDRISLTLAALASAHLVIVLISGQAKREIVTGPADKPIHALIAAAKGKVRIFWTP